MARIDANVGVWRAPAGIIANIQNGVAAAIKFSDTELGDLNNSKHQRHPVGGRLRVSA